MCSFRLCESIVANPIIYRLVPRPSRFENRQWGPDLWRGDRRFVKIGICLFRTLLDVECYSAPQLFGLPYQHMMIDEDHKYVGVFAIESQSEDESTRDRSVLHTQMDISCHFLTFIDTRMIVSPGKCSFTLLNL